MKKNIFPISYILYFLYRTLMNFYPSPLHPYPLVLYPYLYVWRNEYKEVL